MPKASELSLKNDFRVRYTYDSNAIEGNTLTLAETKVVLEGITIGGKSIKEHLEIINHSEALSYIYDLVLNNENLSENQIKQIHYLALKGINEKEAGNYRKVPVVIKGAEHTPPPFYEISAKMDDFIKWYKSEAIKLHPIIRASRVHILFVGIHPFIDGNGRISRLIMNFELLKAKYPAINIKNDNKLEYFTSLDKAHCNNDFLDFDKLVANGVLEQLQIREKMLKECQKGNATQQ